MRFKFSLRLAALAACLFLLSGCTEIPTPQPTSAPAAISPAGETLEVHFIDVGQADSALLLCGGQAMLIDGGNAQDSSLVVSYLEKLEVSHLDYVVCTHAHEDHVGGLSGPLNTCTAASVLSPSSQYESKAFESFIKYTQAQGLFPRRPAPDETFSLGGATVTVLGPRLDYEQVNDTSIVLRVVFGETSFLFTGDMERTAEADLLEAGCPLASTVLKVGHHGSATSTSYPFLREVMPQYAVISVGLDNPYGHPSQEVLSRLYDAGAQVYRTDLLGSVTAVSDGQEIVFTTERPGQPDAGRDQAGSGQTAYIGNKNSHVFHLDTCANLPAAKNQVLFDSREQALSAGYRPCGGCAP